MNPVFELIAFIFIIIICFYLPSKLIITKIKLELNTLENLFFSVTLGLLLFTLIAYSLAWLHSSILLFPIMLVMSFLAIKNKSHKTFKKIKIHKTSLVLVIICSFIFSMSMLVTGIYGDNIIYRRDDLWHLALINELKVHFPPDNPGISEVPLRGYHFFYNFLVAQVSNISFISPASLHFHLFPLLIALLWGFGVYSLMLKWTGINKAALWAVFLTMFGGNFVFILHLTGFTQYSLDNGLGIAQPAFSLYNPPLSISVVIVIFALFSLHQYLTTQKNAWLIPFSLACGLAPMFKVYGGIVLLAGFCLFVLLQLVRKKIVPLVALLATGILFWGTYWIFVGGTGYLIYFPFWNRESILRILGWFGWDEKINTYTTLDVKRGIIETAGTALGMFLVGNLGTRFIGIVLLPLLYFKKRKRPSEFALLLLFMLIIAIIFPLFFLQSGKVYEIVQMATYYLFLGSLFAGFGFGLLFSINFNKYFKYILLIIILFLTLPSAYSTIKGYSLVPKSAVSLSNEYFQSMNFVNSLGTYDDTIIELPPRNSNTDEKSIQYWYDHSNPAINAFTNKRSFYNYQYIEFPGVQKNQKIAVIKKILLSNKAQENDLKKALKKNNIVYIYSQYELPTLHNIKFIKKIYSNKSAVIYKVN